MLGLIYKDFISIKGKRISIGLLAGVIGLIILGIVFSKMNDPVLLELMVGFPAILLMIIQLFINASTSRLVEDDRKNKLQNYLGSLPVKKSTFIAARYIFTLIMAAAMIIIYSVVAFAYKKILSAESLVSILRLTDRAAIILLVFMLFVTGIELPLFICLGYEKATTIKTSFLIMLALIAIGYLLFGDLSVFKNFDYLVIIKFIDNYKEKVNTVMAFASLITVVEYLLSYLITCVCYSKREQ